MSNDFLNPFGTIIWEDRYALKDENGDLIEKSIFDSFRRTSKATASKEKTPAVWEDEYFHLLSNALFSPAGRILAHSGTHYSQLLNCFVLPFKDDSLEEIMKTASNMAIVQKFGGGCIGGESTILTNKGPISVKKIVEDKDESLRVLSYNEKTGETEFCAVLAHHTTPLTGERVFEIEFGVRGAIAKMRASDWHPFFVFDGEKVVQVRADQLKPGMSVIGSSALNGGYDEWGWLLGYIAGDGAVSPNGSSEHTRIRIVDAGEDCIARASKILMSEAYADVADKIKNEFGGHQVCSTKHIPDSIWESAPEKRFSFLVGYLDADGWFNTEKKRFEVFSISEKLAHGVMALAGSLGIRSTIRFRKSRKSNESDGWEVRFSKSHSFSELVVSASAKYNASNTGWACGSVGLSPVWKDKLASVGVEMKTRVAWKGTVNIDGLDVSLVNWLQSGRATREISAAILRTCGEELLARSVLSSQVVKSVKATNVAETLYDLTVDKNQTYIASDPTTGAYVVVHNTGFNYSNLRPAGSYIKGVNGHSCGVIGFIDMMSKVSEVIEQGGSRRGANLGLLEVQHPDLWEFISYKTDHNWDRLEEFVEVKDHEKWSAFKFENLYKLQMYNVSVGVSDEFFDAVNKDANWSFMWKGVEWLLHTVEFKKKQADGTFKSSTFEVMADTDKTALWKVRKLIPFPTANDVFVILSKRQVKAVEVWNRICYNAWADGCPGLLNMSTLRRMHNLEYARPILATNPCGEQPLPENGACNLGSLNLKSFVVNGVVDYARLKKAVYTSIRFLDSVLDNCTFPLKDIEAAVLSERRVGLGTMGVHDLLIAMKLGYDTQEGRDVVEKILRFIRDEAYRANIELAKEKGPFPLFDAEKYLQSGFIQTLPLECQEDIAKYGVRCATVLSQAPTGTIGTMYNVSNGCEPWFDLDLTRNTRLGSFEDGCPAFIQWKKDNPNMDPIKDRPSYFTTAGEISYEDHVKMMVVFSKYNDTATSKTVNLPNSATVEDVKRAFTMAMEAGVKGMTVFRDGCKQGVLVRKSQKSQDTDDEEEDDVSLHSVEVEETRNDPKARGNRTVGATTRVRMNKHNLYVTVNRNYAGNVVEVFSTVGESKSPNTHHTSGIEDSWAEALSKITSLALRAGVTPESIIRNLKNIPSDKPVFSTIGDLENSELIPSPPHAVARVMEEELRYESATATTKKPDPVKDGGNCSDCGSSKIKWKSPTCYECLSCGYSGCGS